MSSKVIAILGVGPGLGMSMARRFGREGFAVALVSRTDARHEGYRASLAADGVESRSYVADVTDEAALREVLDRITGELGPIDTTYFGPADAGIAAHVRPLTGAGPADVLDVVALTLAPAVALVRAVLDPMLERGDGAMFFPGGLSGRHPMPRLGTLAPASAALRMYVLTLHAALREHGVYAATLTIGGLVDRGDIHRSVQGSVDIPDGALPDPLDPDAIADTAWGLYERRDSAEAEFSALVADPAA